MPEQRDVPVTRPVIGAEEEAAVLEVLRSGMLVQGPRVAAFEAAVAELTGSSHAVALSNCTTALRLALVALGTGPGDLVIVAPYSWVATANVIELCGATPVFVDVDPATFNLDAERLDAVLHELRRSSLLHRVRAVMPVHTFGNPAGMDTIAAACTAHGVDLVEDAACALGATLDDRAAGSLGRIGCFSFHPRKIITTGEGGMLVTDDERIAGFARAYRNHGQVPVDGTVQFDLAGDNLRLTEMQGALGVEQMRRLPTLVAERADLAARYDERIASLGCTPQRRSPGAAVQSYVMTVPEGIGAQPVIAGLRARGVEATIGTNAIPFVRHFERRYGLREADLPVTARLGATAVTLPLFPGMGSDAQDRVVDALAAALGEP